MKKRTLLFIIVFCIIGSIIIRLPFLNRPISFHHERLIIQPLVINQVWYRDGGWTYRFCPVMTYNNGADRYISNAAASLLDDKGIYYYTSFPPFAYIFPYCMFSLLKIYPDVLPLQIFNVILHIISSIFIYFIVSLVTEKSNLHKTFYPSFIAFVFYIFSPGPLWFQSNVYMAEMCVQPIFICGIFLLALIIMKKTFSLLYYFLLVVVTFLMVYTEWLGVFYTIVGIGIAFLMFSNKRVRWAGLIIGISAIISLCVTMFQYSTINGIQALYESTIHHYVQRSGLFETSTSYHNILSPLSWGNVFIHYLKSYGPLIVFLSYCIIVYYHKRQTPVVTQKIKNVISISPGLIVVLISLIPVILHHLILFNFTAVHEYSVLKSGVFLSIMAGVMYDRLIIARSDNNNSNLRARRNIIHLCIFFAILLSIAQFIVLNFQNDNSYKTIGEEIKQHIRSDEVIFMKTEKTYILNFVFYYAKRNIALWESYDRAQELLRLNNSPRGVIVSLTPNQTHVERFDYLYRCDKTKEDKQ
jgi:hypothetical protein